MKLNFTYSRILMVKKTKVRQNGEAPIYLRITIDGDNTECYLGQIVPKEHWDGEKKKCLESYPEHQSVNDKIDEVLDEIKAHFIVQSKKNQRLNTEEVKQAYLGEQKGFDGEEATRSDKIALLEIITGCNP